MGNKDFFDIENTNYKLRFVALTSKNDSKIIAQLFHCDEQNEDNPMMEEVVRRFSCWSNMINYYNQYTSLEDATFFYRNNFQSALN